MEVSWLSWIVLSVWGIVTVSCHNRNIDLEKFSLRFKNNVRLLLKQRLHPVYASNGSSEGSEVTKSSEVAKGPPILTILAGLLVFLAVFWVIGSFVTWLISLIFQMPSSKWDSYCLVYFCNGRWMFLYQNFCLAELEMVWSM